MNREFIDLISSFPVMREAFESLPEWDKKAICDGLRGCCVTPKEEEGIAIARNAGFFLQEEES